MEIPIFFSVVEAFIAPQNQKEAKAEPKHQSCFLEKGVLSKLLCTFKPAQVQGEMLGLNERQWLPHFLLALLALCRVSGVAPF